MSWVTLGENCYQTYGFDIAGIAKIREPEQGVLNTVEIDGFQDYGGVHCDGRMFSFKNYGFDIAPEEIGDYIKHHEFYNGQGIRLLSCNAGAYEDGAAQKLADYLKVPVLAAVGAVHVNELGKILVLDEANSKIQSLVAQGDYRTTEEWQKSQWKLFSPSN